MREPLGRVEERVDECEAVQADREPVPRGRLASCVAGSPDDRVLLTCSPSTATSSRGSEASRFRS